MIEKIVINEDNKELQQKRLDTVSQIELSQEEKDAVYQSILDWANS